MSVCIKQSWENNQVSFVEVKQSVYARKYAKEGSKGKQQRNPVVKTSGSLFMLSKPYKSITNVN